MPHAHCFITGASKDIQIVWVEANAVDIVVMANVHFEWFNMVGGPKTGGAVVGASEEVMSMRTPGHIPYWIIVTTVCDET